MVIICGENYLTSNYCLQRLSHKECSRTLAMFSFPPNLKRLHHFLLFFQTLPIILSNNMANTKLLFFPRPAWSEPGMVTLLSNYLWWSELPFTQCRYRDQTMEQKTKNPWTSSGAKTGQSSLWLPLFSFVYFAYEVLCVSLKHTSYMYILCCIDVGWGSLLSTLQNISKIPECRESPFRKTLQTY